MKLTNNTGQTVIEVEEKEGSAKIRFLKPEDMTISEWKKHIVPFQKFMSALKIKARRRN
tara:strand:+ start:195 stop:371 length:177 start_codon:yes stop_codon:yes gene_type:complete